MPCVLEINSNGELKQVCGTCSSVLKALYIHYNNAYGNQGWKSGALWGAHIHKVVLLFDYVVLRDDVTN